MANPKFDIVAGWEPAHATFYGGPNGEETLQGACGYGNTIRQGYGLQTAALSTALFNNGAACCACFEIYCANDPQWCKKPATSIKITATNFCPPNYTKTVDIWCNPPQKHFDLTLPMFARIAYPKAGIVPVSYRRIPCVKRGGMRFEIKASGNPYFILVLVYNVGGVGDVVSVRVKGTRTGWIHMQRSWGQNWATAAQLRGQGMSFEAVTGDGRAVRSINVVPWYWSFGQTFEERIFELLIRSVSVCMGFLFLFFFFLFWFWRFCFEFRSS